MNEVMHVIKARRSIRSYQPQQIKNEELKTILEAGVFAPSSQNTQPWFFSVCQNPALIEKVNDWIIDEANYVKDNPKAREIAATRNASLFRKAPTLIIVSGDRSNPLVVENCSCAAQNMMLAAESIGLGTCWISYVAFLANREVNLPKYRAELRIPAGYAPLFGITVGYESAGTREPPHPRRKGVFVVLV
jgi:nitroreductase